MNEPLSNQNPVTNATVFLGIGSNLGDRIGWLFYALAKLGTLVHIEDCSDLWTSPPVNAAGGEFFNIAVRIQTNLAPGQLLEIIKDIESETGRTGTGNDARKLDIDIIYFGNLKIDEPQLQIPHPRRLERSFVLAPLGQICKDAMDPELNIAVSRLAYSRLPALIPQATSVPGENWIKMKSRENPMEAGFVFLVGDKETENV